jgi:hypothetical protein
MNQTSRSTPRERRDNWANILVCTDAPQYPAMLEKARTADQRLWRLDKQNRGVWVVSGWLQGARFKPQSWRRFSDEDLRAIYAPPEKTASDPE